jgi:hypothetical protein
MKMFSALVQIAEDSKICKCEVSEYEGKLWIVADSLENIVTGKITLSRLIFFENLKHQKKVDHPKMFVDFLVNDPIPICVFDGQIPPGTNFQVLELPLITAEVPSDTKFH